MKQEPYVSHHSRSLQDSQIQNALRHRKDAVNFEQMVTEACNLEEEFVGKLKTEEVQVHVQQEQQQESTLQALVKKGEELEGVIKKRQNRTHMKQRKEPLTCNDCGILGHLSSDCRKDTDTACHGWKQKGHLSMCCRVR